MNKVVGLIFWIAVMIWSLPAFAVPALQLDIVDLVTPSWYNAGGDPRYNDETIMSGGDKFTLYALMQTSEKTSLTNTYYISMALYLSPGSATPPASYGSFLFDNHTFEVTHDMVWGKPALLRQSHEVFNTYYKQVSFKFDSDHRVGKYDTQTETGRFEEFSGGRGLYYKAFSVDTSLLNHSVSIHFDLYNSRTFAPFSHDAQSDPPPGVPEPGTILLLGLGLVGLTGIRRKIRS